MSQILIPTAVTAESLIAPSYGYTTLTAVQQVSGYVQANTSHKDSAYATYSVGADKFELPLPGEGVFSAYLSGVKATRTTSCGTITATAYPEARLYIKGVLKATLTATSTSPAYKTATISSADVASITKLSDIAVQAVPRVQSSHCFAPNDGQNGKTYYVYAHGQVLYLEVSLPDGPLKVSLEMGCVF